MKKDKAGSEVARILKTVLMVAAVGIAMAGAQTASKPSPGTASGKASVAGKPAENAGATQRAVKTLSDGQRTPLRKQALAALEEIKEGGKDCPIRADQPMVEYRACLAGSVMKTEGEYKKFMTAMRTLLVTPKPEDVSDSGMQRWYADNRRDFDAAANAWMGYYGAECKAETSLVEPGSGMAETQANCQLAMLKERAQRVRDVYGEMLGLNGYK